jgi:hypothetical protein
LNVPTSDASDFFDAIKSLTNLVKLDIKRMKVVYQRVLDLIGCLKKLKYFGYEVRNDLRKADLKIKYPTIKFRWYYENYNNEKNQIDIDIYEGNFGHNNLIEGHGVFYWSHLGCIYEGEWKSDMRYGYGHFILSGVGSKFKGEWENEERYGTEKQFLTTKKMKNVFEYEGEWKKDKMDGKGILRFRSGDYYENLKRTKGTEKAK